MSEGKLLVAGPTIAFSPILARVVGIEEALVLQQLHYRMHCATSDPYDRWTYVRHKERGFVGWSKQGRIDDLLLKEYPFKRVLASLRLQRLVIEARGLDNKWDRRIFLSIDHTRVASMCGEKHISTSAINAIDSVDDSTSMIGTLHPSQVIRKDMEKRERDGPLLLDELLRRVESFVGTGSRDDHARDKRCLDRINAMVSTGQIETHDLAEALYDPSIRYLSQLEKSLNEIIKVGIAADAILEQKEALQSEREKETCARVRDSALRDVAARFLISCSDDTLQRIATQVRDFDATPPLTKRAVASVNARMLGQLPASTLVLRALLERRDIGDAVDAIS
jgi:hypothetical protein